MSDDLNNSVLELLSAIGALNKTVKELEKENTELKARLDEVESLLKKFIPHQKTLLWLDKEKEARYYFIKNKIKFEREE